MSRVRIEGRVACVLAAAVVALAVAAGARAQVLITEESDIQSVEPGSVPCVGMPQTQGFREDPALAVTGFTATVRTAPGQYGEPVDRATLTWTPPADPGLLCLGLWDVRPDGGRDATVSIYPFLGTKVTIIPPPLAPAPREACWELQAIADGRVGPPVRTCARIENAPQILIDDTFPTQTQTQTPTAPGPPDTGSGVSTGRDGAWSLAVGAVAAVLAGALAFASRRRA
ncbi:MAG: hypothetical protein IT303_13625 [Dehalococcoidia bacterium]|nr:hypothetical protein [Dehalococcoidia bacterium]